MSEHRNTDACNMYSCDVEGPETRGTECSWEHLRSRDEGFVGCAACSEKVLLDLLQAIWIGMMGTRMWGIDIAPSSLVGVVEG